MSNIAAQSVGVGVQCLELPIDVLLKHHILALCVCRRHTVRRKSLLSAFATGWLFVLPARLSQVGASTVSPAAQGFQC
jgi:hypothetical protein